MYKFMKWKVDDSLSKSSDGMYWFICCCCRVSLNAHSLPCSCPTLAEEKREKKEVTTTYIILVPRGDLGSLQITPDIWSALDPQSMAHHGNPYGNLS